MDVPALERLFYHVGGPEANICSPERGGVVSRLGVTPLRIMDP